MCMSLFDTSHAATEGCRTVKTENMLVRVRPEEKQAFQDAAEASGLALSAWVRERLRHAAIRELEGIGRQAAFVPSMLPRRAPDA
jgi:hypothetical protein